jgi:hypothetical protein
MPSSPLADAAPAKGVTGATAKQVEMLQQAVRSSIENHSGTTVEHVGEGMPKKTEAGLKLSH